MRYALFLLTVLLPCCAPQPAHSAPSWQIVYYGSYSAQDVDYTILDLFEFSPASVARAKRPIAYFSAHYENWRPDAKQFGKRLRKIGGWKGEYYIDWRDPRNQAVMLERLELAKRKGFVGVDIDNVDGPGGREYFPWLLREAKKRDLLVGLKNFVEILPTHGAQVDFFVSEATAAAELSCYQRFGKPVVRMYYGRGVRTPGWIYECRSKRNGSRF